MITINCVAFFFQGHDMRIPMVVIILFQGNIEYRAYNTLKIQFGPWEMYVRAQSWMDPWKWFSLLFWLPPPPPPPPITITLVPYL